MLQVHLWQLVSRHHTRNLVVLAPLAQPPPSQQLHRPLPPPSSPTAGGDGVEGGARKRNTALEDLPTLVPLVRPTARLQVRERVTAFPCASAPILRKTHALWC